jgi:uncharacterized protein YndB with AHSA1/START domain
MTTEFIVDRMHHAIQVKRSFQAPVATVWAAFTKAEILDQWWAPKPWYTKTKSMDFRPGGRWIYAMCGPAGEVYWSFMAYESIEFEKSFIAEEGFCDIDGNPSADFIPSRWTSQFDSTPSGSYAHFFIQFSNVDELEKIVKMGFEEGFTSALQNVDELISAHIF